MPSNYYPFPCPSPDLRSYALSTAGAHHFIVDSKTAFNPKRVMELPLPLWKPIKHLNGGDTVITVCKKLVQPTCWCDFHDFTVDSKKFFNGVFRWKIAIEMSIKTHQAIIQSNSNFKLKFQVKFAFSMKSRTSHLSKIVELWNEQWDFTMWYNSWTINGRFVEIRWASV